MPCDQALSGESTGMIPSRRATSMCCGLISLNNFDNGSFVRVRRRTQPSSGTESPGLSYAILTESFIMAESNGDISLSLRPQPHARTTPKKQTMAHLYIYACKNTKKQR